ncbi:MAG: hypothetical protein ACI856_002473, partial [Kiritimatiellia bacterium]
MFKGIFMTFTLCLSLRRAGGRALTCYRDKIDLLCRINSKES